MFFFRNLDFQIAGLVEFKRIYIKTDQRVFLCAKILKISIVIKNVIWSEKNFFFVMHYGTFRDERILINDVISLDLAHEISL